MFAAYLDESGTDAEADLLWFGGYIADSSTWFDFSREWRRVLLKHSIPALHMREYTASRGPFVGWSSASKKALLADAIDVLSTWDLFGVTIGIDKAAFHEVVAASKLRGAVKLSGEPARDPYLWVFQDMVIEFATRIDHLHSSERVAFVADRHPFLQPAALRLYEGMRSEHEWPRHSRLGSLSFEEAAHTPPLQAADLLAHEIRKERYRRIHPSDREPRVSLSRLRKRLWSARYWDRARLNEVVEGSRA
jgi:Protein of unknown function (DUF3800)